MDSQKHAWSQIIEHIILMMFVFFSSPETRCLFAEFLILSIINIQSESESLWVCAYVC